MSDPLQAHPDTPERPPALRFAGVRKVYSDGTEALRGVDLDVQSGMVGLLGPNGAGKTTLLSILTLAQQPTSGRRDYFGLGDSPRRWPTIRRRIGYLPQEYQPVQGLSGAEYLHFCASMRGVPLRRRALRRRVDDLLDAVELGAAARRAADTYSGGMIRRLGLAQALIHSPDLLVVDEPTAGLDPEERIRFRNLVTELADRIPVLLSTHIVEDIEATCPRLAILGHGTKLYDGPPTELMRRVQGTLWRRPDEAEPFVGERKIGRRVDEDGSAWAIVHLETEARGDLESVTPTLEEACSTFLALHGESSLSEPADPKSADSGGSEPRMAGRARIATQPEGRASRVREPRADRPSRRPEADLTSRNDETEPESRSEESV